MLKQETGRQVFSGRKQRLDCVKLGLVGSGKVNHLRPENGNILPQGDRSSGHSSLLLGENVIHIVVGVIVRGF